MKFNKDDIIDGPRSYDRMWDTEYKILEKIADQLGTKWSSSGKIDLFTERPACASCLNVISQFEERYPNIQVNVFYDILNSRKSWWMDKMISFEELLNQLPKDLDMFMNGYYNMEPLIAGCFLLDDYFNIINESEEQKFSVNVILSNTLLDLDVILSNNLLDIKVFEHDVFLETLTCLNEKKLQHKWNINGVDEKVLNLRLDYLSQVRDKLIQYFQEK